MVSKKLHSTMHVIMHEHEYQLLSCAEPADQLVTTVQEPCKCLEKISLTFDKIFKCLGIFVLITGEEDNFPFGHTNLLKTLFDQQKQCGTVVLLVHRQARNNLPLEVGEHLCKQKLRSKVGLVGHDASSQHLPVHRERYLDTIRLLQAVLNRLI
jgi:hypothetical protein